MYTRARGFRSAHASQPLDKRPEFSTLNSAHCQGPRTRKDVIPDEAARHKKENVFPGSMKDLDTKTDKFFSKVVSFVVIGLMISLFAIILKEFYHLLSQLIHNATALHLIETVLIIFVLIKIFGVFSHYLKNHFVSVSRVIEVAIITVVQDSIFKVFSVEPLRIFALGFLLIVLGGLYIMEKREWQKKDTED